MTTRTDPRPFVIEARYGSLVACVAVRRGTEAVRRAIAAMERLRRGRR